MRLTAIKLHSIVTGCMIFFLFQLYTHHIVLYNSVPVLDHDQFMLDFDNEKYKLSVRNGRSNPKDDEESITPSFGSRIDRPADERLQRKEEEHEEKRACRVIIENPVDFHHEVLESVVLRFPLPWHTFKNCSVSQPIIYDFSLYQNRFHLHIPAASMGSGAKNAKFLNQTEFFSWKKYFEKHLQYKVFDRKEDEHSITLYNHNSEVKETKEDTSLKTQAYFNQLIPYEEYGGADAVIDATCDINTKFVKTMKRSNNFFCVLHGDNKNVLTRKENQFIYKRSCFLSPMWPQSVCTFLAADLPKFDDVVKDRKLKQETNICVLGSRNITLATELFSSIPYKEKNVRFQVFSRKESDSSPIQASFNMFGLGHKFASVVHELDYENYHRNVACCDIFLPLTDPLNRPSHFPSGGKKSTGLVPILAAYEIAAIMHTEFAKLYKHHLRAPFEEYNDTFQSKIDALNRLLITVIQEKSSHVSFLTR